MQSNARLIPKTISLARSVDLQSSAKPPINGGRSTDCRSIHRQQAEVRRPDPHSSTRHPPPHRLLRSDRLPFAGFGRCRRRPSSFFLQYRPRRRDPGRQAARPGDRRPPLQQRRGQAPSLRERRSRRLQWKWFRIWLVLRFFFFSLLVVAFMV